MPFMTEESFKQLYPNHDGVVKVKKLTPADMVKYNVKPPHDKLLLSHLFPSNNLIPNTINEQGVQNNVPNNIQEILED